MQVTLLHGYPDLVGRRRLIVAFGNSVTPYTQGSAGGDAITGLPFQFYIDSIPGVAISTDGTIIAIPQVTATGARQTWKFRYFNFTTSGVGVELSTGVITPKSFQFFLIGGTY